MSKNAVAVVARLREAGFAAYLVGGCVRDLLLGRAPKDFDVATDARPEDICALFQRARLVGRRFRIVHVRMRGEMIEVSTFRGVVDAETAGPAPTSASRLDDAAAHVAANGVILRDNAYGTLDEDALRRDFTVNALYYDPAEDVLLDYCDGLADIGTRTLRLIGNPAIRFREDPVRILRAVRFAAKLDLAIDNATEAAIAPTREMLAAVPPARLFDEFGKLFLSGHGARAFALLEHFGLIGALLPLPKSGDALFRRALANTDERLGANKPVTPGFLLAALLWPDYRQRCQQAARASRVERQHAVEQAGKAGFAALRRTIATPRRHTYFARDIWELQPQLERRPESAADVIAHRRFRAAYDFLLLRAQIGEVPAALAEWWTQAQTPGAGPPSASATERAFGNDQGAALAGEEAADSDAATGGNPAPKRRRRRRRRGRSRGRADAAAFAANGSAMHTAQGGATSRPGP